MIGNANDEFSITSCIIDKHVSNVFGEQRFIIVVDVVVVVVEVVIDDDGDCNRLWYCPPPPPLRPLFFASFTINLRCRLSLKNCKKQKQN